MCAKQVAEPMRTAAAFERSCIFWGKFVPDGPRCLPLTAHCIDVALVLRGLCNLNGIQRALGNASDSPLTDQQLDRLGVLAMLHDVGKANLGFQRKVFDPKSPRSGHVRELAPLLDFEALDEGLHEAFVQSLSPDIGTWFSDEQAAYSYLLASFSHHGRPLKFRGEKSGTYWQARNDWWRPQGPWDPMDAVADIMNWARQAFPNAFEVGGLPLPAEPRFHHRFAGLLMLADWLGSHPSWFPVEQVQLADRLRRDRETIPVLLRAVGLDVASLRNVLVEGPQDFNARFNFPPRPLQAAIDALDPGDESTRIVIAESETGSGKTEAALNWFFKLFAAGKVDGLYFALPTRVAARELYRRVRQTMECWFPDPFTRPITVLAVPGYAQVDGLPPKQALPEEEAGNRWQDDDALRRRERQWAAEHPKRFLAASVAVGTIDQALLSIVQTAHAHLRSVCLDRNLLVVDEVHASDFYMSRLLKFLLDHHLGIGGQAMLLSATLGARARQCYVSVARDERPLPDLNTAQTAPYPAVTLADGTPCAAAPSPGQAKQVRFEELPLAFQPEAVGDHLVQALIAGARILVVMNTVDRANALLRAMEDRPDVYPGWFFSCQGVICPHHGRFAPEDRVLLDARVGERLGPGSPPGALLLIGTQTLEQSLDIDADLLISDLAPADVLLQRVGRLHRHRRVRPSGYETPRCLLLTPDGELESALDQRGNVAGTYKRIGYGSVYEDLRTLELTRRELAERSVVSIPGDNRRLVEAVTHPERLSSLEGERWAQHGQNIEGGELAQAIAASNATAIFDEYFGEFEFNEAGGRVTVRLGADKLQLPLDRPVTSPFRQSLRELVIPGHMAPSQPEDVVTVEGARNDSTILRCADRHYCYSRYGLEEAT